MRWRTRQLSHRHEERRARLRRGNGLRGWRERRPSSPRLGKSVRVQCSFGRERIYLSYVAAPQTKVATTVSRRQIRLYGDQGDRKRRVTRNSLSVLRHLPLSPPTQADPRKADAQKR